MATAYSPLHCRSYYSLLKGCLPPEQICRYAAEQGSTAVGMVDINNFYGVIRFLQAAERWNLKPVCGVDIEHQGELLFTVYVQNLAGFGRANEIITRVLYESPTFSGVEKRQEQPVYDPLEDLLESGWEGLSIVSSRPEVLDRLAARTQARLYAGLVYGRSFNRITSWARKRNIPLFAVNHGMHLTREDRQFHRVLRAIDNNVTVDALPPDEICVKENKFVSPVEMERYFSAVPDALEHPLRLAEEAECRGIIRNKFVFPGFRGMAEGEAFRYLRRLCTAGIRRRYGDLRPDITARLEYELSIIRAKGFSSYFLVVHDIVSRWPRTCGRGSSAASIVSYLLGITHVDPLKHNLFFERFLNMDRKDPPDIDVDFPWDEREKALRFVFEKYSRRSGMVADHVTFGPRSALREPAKAMGLTPEEIGRIIRFKKHGDLDKIPGYILRAYKRARGVPRHIGTHPGGVVITPGELTGYTHLQPTPSGYPVIAWEKDGTEDAGLVKIDLLGNRSLGVLRDTLNLVNPIRRGEKREAISWEGFSPLTDGNTRALIESGGTLGVFYVESPATRQLLQKMGRGDYEHLVIASSIIRPAANRFIQEFVRRLHGGAYDPLHPLIAATLKETCGIMVYQEDVARVAIAVAGFSPSEADSLRKVLTKKERTVRIAGYRRRFYRGGRSNGVEKAVLDRLWEMILSFDGYSFCKPHSASYALVSYRLAWLKRYYPLQFFVSVINNGGGFYSRQVYINAIRRMGVPVLGPDVNESEYRYTVSGRTVRVGLSQLKKIPSATLLGVLKEREKNGRFLDFFDFVRRIVPECADMRIFIRSGCLDTLSAPFTRPQLFWVFYHMEKTPVLFDAPAVPACVQDYSRARKVVDEIRTLGVLYSCHPLEMIPPSALPVRKGLPLMIDSRSLNTCLGLRVCITGYLVAGKEVLTRNRRFMSFVSFDDPFALFETVVFPGVYRRLGIVLEEHVTFLVIGTVKEGSGAYTLEVEDLVPLGRH